jgi:PAS domain S-box-containing protein
MNLNDLSELEDDMRSINERPRNEPEALTLRSGVGIVIADTINQRLVETASIQLELDTVNFDPEAFLALQDAAESEAARLATFELIIADEPIAARIRAILTRRESSAGVLPAVVAVVPNPEAPQLDPRETLGPNDHSFDGVLPLPQLPAPLAAQLSLILYSHRAFARRYQDALEELHLNRRIFRSVTSGITVANALLPDMPLTYVNPAFEAMTGYCFEEVQGRNCRFLQGPENGPDRDQPAIPLLRDAIAAGREITVVLKNFRKDGSPFWNELSLSPIRNREGEVTHFVGIQTDVSARVEIEAALRESEKLAAVGRLASTIAHEINNPLESVMNLIYLAERAETPAQTRQYLTTADRELQRVKLITTQSLRFFKQSTKPQAIGCTELIDSVLDLYQSRIQNAHVTVSRRERSTRNLVCMESEIRQVLNNLVSNAIDAMNAGCPPRDSLTVGGGIPQSPAPQELSPQETGLPPQRAASGGVGGLPQKATPRTSRLLVRTREGTEPRSGRPGVVITIADTGVGISPDTLRNIYKAFYTTKGISGTGLGLWISSEIVERHHGRLLVRSSTRDGRHGTVFALYLPYQGLSPS